MLLKVRYLDFCPEKSITHIINFICVIVMTLVFSQSEVIRMIVLENIAFSEELIILYCFVSNILLWVLTIKIHSR